MSIYLPVQAPVLDRLGEVLLAEMVASLQVGDGPGHLEDAGEGTGREAEPVGDQFQHPVAGGVQFAVLPEVAGGHLGEAMGRYPEQLSDLLNGRHYPFKTNREKVERYLDEVMSRMQCLKDFDCQSCPAVTKAAFNGLQERNRHPPSKKTATKPEVTVRFGSDSFP